MPAYSRSSRTDGSVWHATSHSATPPASCCFRFSLYFQVLWWLLNQFPRPIHHHMVFEFFRKDRRYHTPSKGSIWLPAMPCTRRTAIASSIKHMLWVSRKQQKINQNARTSILGRRLNLLVFPTWGRKRFLNSTYKLSKRPFLLYR